MSSRQSAQKSLSKQTNSRVVVDDLKRSNKRNGSKPPDLRASKRRREEQEADALLYRAWKKTFENARKGKRVG